MAFKFWRLFWHFLFNPAYASYSDAWRVWIIKPILKCLNFSLWSHFRPITLYSVPQLRFLMILYPQSNEKIPWIEGFLLRQNLSLTTLRDIPKGQIVLVVFEDFILLKRHNQTADRCLIFLVLSLTQSRSSILVLFQPSGSLFRLAHCCCKRLYKMSCLTLVTATSTRMFLPLACKVEDLLSALEILLNRGWK